MAPDRATLCYQAIFRDYRNAVLAQIRRTLSVAEIRQLFSDEQFAKEKANAIVSRNAGLLTNNISDDYDILGVNHFYNLFERYFDKLFAVSSQNPTFGVQKQSILSCAREIKLLRDPTAHPVSEDIPRDDAFRVIDNAERIVRPFDAATADKLQLIKKEIMNGSDPTDSDSGVREPLESSLPPRHHIVLNFIGRNFERDVLWRWLGDRHAPLWALAGAGGTGKTSIAYRFAEEVQAKAPEELRAVLWLTAKQKRFSDGRLIDAADRPVTDLASTVTELLMQVGAGADEQAWDTDKKCEYLLEFFGTYPVLIVADDIDSLEGAGEEAIQFLTLQIPRHTSCKVLITSRRVLFGLAGITTEVKGFEQSEGTQFIMSRVRLMNLDAGVFSGRVIREILEATGGSPLYIGDLLRFCLTGERVDKIVSEWKTRKGDEARKYALSREFDLLSENAKAVLYACVVADDPVSFDELVLMTQVIADQMGDAITELQRLFIITRPTLVEGIERFALNYNTRQLVYRIAQGHEKFERIVAAYRTISRDEQFRVARARAASPYIRQAVFLVKSDKQEDAERTLIQGLDKHPESPELLAHLGWLYKRWRPPRITDAREKFERASALKADSSPMYLHWIRMEAAERNWGAAAKAAELGLEQAKYVGWDLHAWAGLSRSHMGQELMRQEQFSRARQEFDIARSHLIKALRPAEQTDSVEEWDKRPRNYRSLVLSEAAVIELDMVQYDQEPSSKTLKSLAELLRDWAAEYPQDIDAFTERERLLQKFSGLAKHLIG